MICHQEWTNNLQVKQWSINNSNNLISHHLHYLRNFLQSWLVVVQWVGPTILLDYLLLHHRMMANLRNFFKLQEILPHFNFFYRQLCVGCFFLEHSLLALFSVLLCFTSWSDLISLYGSKCCVSHSLIYWEQFNYICSAHHQTIKLYQDLVCWLLN